MWLVLSPPIILNYAQNTRISWQRPKRYHQEWPAFLPSKHVRRFTYGLQRSKNALRNVKRPDIGEGEGRNSGKFLTGGIDIRAETLCLFRFQMKQFGPDFGEFASGSCLRFGRHNFGNGLAVARNYGF